MPRLRKLIPLLMIAALALVALPVSAGILPTAALYQCTVYEDGTLVGVGKTVEAFVGAETEARDSEVTNASGVAILQFSVDEAELGDPVSFEVNGILATETPDVDVSIAGLAVSLDYSGVGTVPPTVVTNAATSVGVTTARINGSLTDLGTASTVSCYLEFGTTTAYGSDCSAVDMTSSGNFWCNLSGLSLDTTYHFRAVAVGDGTSYGDDRTFTTREELPFVTYADWMYDTFIA